LAFLTPNFTNLALFRGRKNCLAFWLFPIFGFLEAVAEPLPESRQQEGFAFVRGGLDVCAVGLDIQI